MIITQSGTKIEQKDYKDENELQELLFNHPELLSEEGTELTSIAREVEVGSAGRIDILDMTSSGIMTLVEVKLGRNSQSRREVLAQILDYISELSTYSYYDLDKKTKGQLESVVSGFENANELPRTIEDNMNNGQIRLIIAVDESNDNLYRIVDFVAKHTDFRVDLIEVKKYINNGELFYNANPIVLSSFSTINERNGITHRSYPFLDKISEKWNSFDELPKIKSKNGQYRQIRIDEWPASVHYEFLKGRESYLVRLDNELPSGDPRINTVTNAMTKYIGQTIDGYIISARAYRQSGSGQVLMISLTEEETDKAPEIMKKLIELTKESIDKALNEK